MQKRALTALIVLATLALGLVGVQPCSARQERSEAPAAAPSCHANQGPARTDMDGHGSSSQERGSSEGCGTSCQHACHMTAVTAATPVAFAIAPVAQAVVEAEGPGLALFVPPIDHIPLV